MLHSEPNGINLSMQNDRNLDQVSLQMDIKHQSCTEN